MIKADFVRRLTGAVLLLLTTTDVSFGQSPVRNLDLFEGCYEVASLSWKPPGKEIKLIPKRFQLLRTPKAGSEFFGIRDLESETGLIRLSGWKPKGLKRMEIHWNGVLGGFRGTLKKDVTGNLEGKVKEWCDYRCEGGRITGEMQVHPIACAPN